MSRPTKAQLRQARRIGGVVPMLQEADVVMAVLPDGSRHLVKGWNCLHAIQATGVGKQSKVTFTPVLTHEIAVALELTLGKDGTYYNQAVAGHA